MTSSSIPLSQSSATALLKLEKVILDSLDFETVVQHTVDSMLTELEFMQLGYRIIVLVLLDKNMGVLKRIAISQTPEGKKALLNSPVPFHNIDIPLTAKDNLLVKVLETKQPYSTTHWPHILTPAFTVEEAVNIQKIVGIKTSLIYPVLSKSEVIGVMIFSLTKDLSLVSSEERELISGFTDLVGLALQNSLLYSSLASTTESLKQANEKLKELDKLKDEFVSLASHELRTPMTVIKSYLWMVLQGKVGPIGDGKQKEYLNRVYKSTNDLISLVNSMLNVSRIEAGKIIVDLVPTDIVQWTKDFVVDIAPRSEETGISVVVEGPEPLPQVMFDSSKMREVFTNIIGNSLKFTPRGGKVTISFTKNEDAIEVHIADNGKGISKEDMPKLFQKFGQTGNDVLTRPLAQGTGLGLYITKAIVQLHGGRIWAESDGEGKGTTFSFSLKVATPKEIDETKDKPAVGTHIQPSATLQPTSL